MLSSETCTQLVIRRPNKTGWLRPHPHQNNTNTCTATQGGPDTTRIFGKKKKKTMPTQKQVGHIEVVWARDSATEFSTESKPYSNFQHF